MKLEELKLLIESKMAEKDAAWNELLKERPEKWNDSRLNTTKAWEAKKLAFKREWDRVGLAESSFWSMRPKYNRLLSELQELEMHADEVAARLQ